MSAAPGRPQGSHGADRKQEDYDKFADQCAGKGEPTSTFFPERGSRSPKRAVELCSSCPVRGECLDYALTYDEMYGVWGGFTETARRTMKRARKRAAAARAEATS